MRFFFALGLGLSLTAATLAQAGAQWKGDLTKALAAAEKAVALAPNDPGYLDTLAGVHYARGEYALAVQEEKRALEKAPGDRELEDRLARFEAAERARAAKIRNRK